MTLYKTSWSNLYFLRRLRSARHLLESAEEVWLVCDGKCSQQSQQIDLQGCGDEAGLCRWCQRGQCYPSYLTLWTMLPTHFMICWGKFGESHPFLWPFFFHCSFSLFNTLIQQAGSWLILSSRSLPNHITDLLFILSVTIMQYRLYTIVIYWSMLHIFLVHFLHFLFFFQFLSFLLVCVLLLFIIFFKYIFLF